MRPFFRRGTAAASSMAFFLCAAVIGFMASECLVAGSVPGASDRSSQIVLRSDDGLTSIILDANSGGLLMAKYEDQADADTGDTTKASTMAFRFTGGGTGQLSMRCGDSVANIYSGDSFGGFTVESREKRTLAQLLAMKFPGDCGTCGVMLYDNDHRSKPKAANTALVLQNGDSILQYTRSGLLKHIALGGEALTTETINGVLKSLAEGLLNGVTVREPERREPPLDEQAAYFRRNATLENLNDKLRYGYPYVDKHTPRGMGYVARR